MGMKIVVADDELDPRMIMDTALSQMGFEVFTVENGTQALEVIAEKDVSMVIADWMMPGINGLDLCRAIRNRKGGGYVYILLLTARNRPEDVIEGFRAGVDDYLIKPFVLDEFEHRVRAGERIVSLERELRERNKNLETLNIRLEELVRIDPLLEIGNRRSFHEVIEKAHDRACRYKQHYGIIMCDIDYFKAYNDLYGHMEGDAVLKKVAASIKKSSRTSDEVFRFGGEEIVVILPDQSLETTALVAGRIRKGVSDLAIEHKGSPFGHLSISCGVAQFEQECEQDRWPLVLEKADKALYRAKEAGRNQICF